MKQVTKLGVLALLIACSLDTTRAASLKSTKLIKKPTEGKFLAQSGCDVPTGELGAWSAGRNALPSECVQLKGGVPEIDCSVCELPPTPEPIVGESPPPLSGAVIAAHGVEASATQLTEVNEFHDHRCAAGAVANKCSEGCESSAAFGCGCRKRTVCLEGDICYRNIRSSTEAGTAEQVIEGCEEANTVTTTSLHSVDTPLPCVSVSVCPPEEEQ
jgi:hypothetical protein